MNIAEFSIKRKTSVLVMTVLIFVGGIFSYFHLGRLEDPEFTLKDALIVTSYPGATAEEVEREVSDVLEKAVQQLGQLKEVESLSQQGLSTLQVTIQDSYTSKKLPQVWDELRRKVSDAQGELPSEAGPSVVRDDFSDVYGVFLAITGDGYTNKELEQAADYLQRELLLVQDVAKITLYGIIPERIYLEMSREKMAKFGIPKQLIYQALAQKNVVADAGQADVGNETISLRPTGIFDSVEDIENLLISQSLQGTLSSTENRILRLGDIATVTRGYQDPPQTIFRVDGQPAIGLAVSTVTGGNVVVMGNALDKRLQEILPNLPFGIELHKVSMQSESVTTAITDFVVSLIEAVLIVIAVLMLAMGLKSGLLIGTVLIITICGTLVIMNISGIIMERVSLGALIIALGMLVDNAIVITEGMMIRIQRGEDKLKSAIAVVGQNALPLLGATFITVLAFGSIGLSDEKAGEYCRSLFQVILISLMVSWVTAVTITPLFCTWFFKPTSGSHADQDPYQSPFFQIYRKFLLFCLHRKWIVMFCMVALLAVSLVGFQYLEQNFFPNSIQPKFQIDVWLPEGSQIRETETTVKQIEEYLTNVEHVTGMVSCVGRGAPRYTLTYSPESLNSCYAYILVSVDDYREIESMRQTIQQDLEQKFPETIPLVYKMRLGHGSATKIQARFSGSDTKVLRALADKAMDIMHDDGGLIGIQTDWRGMVKAYQPVLAEVPARNYGIDNADVASALQETFDGKIIGVYREREDLIPIVSRPREKEHQDITDIPNIQIWSPVALENIQLHNVTSGYNVIYEDSKIVRRDRKRTITVKGNPFVGNASTVLARIMPKIDAIELPPGYELEWAGEYKDSNEATQSILGTFPLFILLMVLIVIFLFDALKQPLIIWLCVPLAAIGVTAGLLAASQPFGFMSLLGFLSLTGMLIKNAIVLIDQIELEIREGKAPFQAIVDSGVSRMRPVVMAAATTVLGMIPLLFDAFFVSMSVTIMAGLSFATVLTLIVVPVLYLIMFRVKPEEEPKTGEKASQSRTVVSSS